MPDRARFALKNDPVWRAACLLTTALLMASCSETSPQASVAKANANAPIVGTATSILNAGVMTQMGAAGGSAETVTKLLFDPLYDDHFGSLEQLPPDLIEAIVTGAPPYDGVDAVFVSHAHGDHFSASQLTRMLASQPQVQLVAPGQAIERMREDDNWQPGFDDRVTAITLENGEAVQSIEISGASIDAFRSPHAGWPDRHAATHNITFRVSVEGDSAAARVMHLGDADPAAEHYAALSEFLSAKRTGLAVVPFWFYGEDGLNAIIDETLNAQASVAVHVPVRIPSSVQDAGLPYFSGVGEVIEIPSTD